MNEKSRRGLGGMRKGKRERSKNEQKIKTLSSHSNHYICMFIQKSYKSFKTIKIASNAFKKKSQTFTITTL